MTEIHLTKLIKHNDTWWKILRLIKDQTVMRKDNTVHMEALREWKDYYKADKVLHNQKGFMLCERIEEVEWVDVDPDDDVDDDGGEYGDEDDTEYDSISTPKKEDYNDDEYEY